MKETLLKLNEEVNFKAAWGSICQPIPREDYFILPLGWEAELDSRDIVYETVELDIIQEDISDMTEID
jgi:hypothetical protein